MTDIAEVQSPESPQPGGGRRSLIFLVVVIGAVVALMLLAPRFIKPRHAGLGSDVAGKAAPDFELKDVNGKLVRLSDYRGKAVILNFWATWCPPCKVETPWFVDLRQRYAGQGLEIIGVAMDDSGDADVAKFATDMKINYPILLGNDTVAQAYGGVEGLPTTFYIGRDGKILQRVPGLLDRKEIEESALKALATKEGAQ